MDKMKRITNKIFLLTILLAIVGITFQLISAEAESRVVAENTKACLEDTGIIEVLEEDDDGLRLSTGEYLDSAEIKSYALIERGRGSWYIPRIKMYLMEVPRGYLLKKYGMPGLVGLVALLVGIFGVCWCRRHIRV